MHNQKLEQLKHQLAPVQVLTPREVGTGKNKKKIARAVYTRQVVAIVV